MYRIGISETVVVILVLLVNAIPFLLLVWFVRYLIRSGRERRLLRLEVGKLAEEVALMRKDADENNDR